MKAKELKFDFDEIFAQNKLLGNYEFTEDEYSELLNETQRICKVALYNNYRISCLNYKLIFVTLVEIAKRWKQEDVESSEEEKSGFWLFVFKTILGYEYFNQVLYNEFQTIIRSLARTDNLPVVKDGKKYYATLMMHSFAPQKSMCSFFDLCFNVFKNDLCYNYIETDYEICNIVRKELKSILSEGYRENKSVAIGSQAYSIKIGIKSFVLHEQLENEFVDLIKNTLILIDCLYHNNEVPHTSRIEKMLIEWWKDKLDCEKSMSVSGSKFSPVPQNNILVKYVRDNNSVYLSVPPIRLDSSYRPIWISIFNKENKILASEEIQTRHGVFTIATKQMSYDLNDLLKDENEINLRVEIYEGESLLYNSADRKNTNLIRDFILFDNNNEIRNNINKPDNYFVYALNNMNGLEYPEETKRNAKNLFNIYPTDGECLSSSHRKVYFVNNNLQRKKKNVYLSGELQNVVWNYNNESYNVFCNNILLNFPTSANINSIRIYINDNDFLLSELPHTGIDDSNNCLIYDMNNIPVNKQVKIKIFSHDQNKILLEENMIFVPNLSINFNHKIYYGEIDKEVTIAFNNVANNLAWTNCENELYYPLLDGELIITIPYLRWRLTNKEWHNEPLSQVQWLDKFINPGTNLELDNTLNNELSLTIITDTIEEIPLKRNCEIEIRKIIDTINASGIITIGMRKYDELRDLKFFDVVSKEQFIKNPISYENNMTIWDPINNFIGDTSRNFSVELVSDKKICFTIEDLKYLKEEITELEEGRYSLKIFSESNSLFVKENQLLYEGDIIIGNPKKFKYLNKKLVIKEVEIFKNFGEFGESKKLNNYCYYVDRLELIEDEYDIYYSATLNIIKNNQTKALDLMPNQAGELEQINPVRIEFRDKNSFYLVAGYNVDNDFLGELFLDIPNKALCNIDSKDKRYAMVNIYRFEEEDTNV